MNHIKIVAEIGCNHNGSIEIAKRLMDEAVKSGVDAVKFQMFEASELVASCAQKADYQKRNTANDESQLDMISKLELTKEEYIELKEYANALNLEMFATAFDNHSIDFLESLGQKIWKIPSGEITNLPYLEKISNIKMKEKEIILSTGMSTIDEIKFAASILSNSRDTKFTILHCNTDYPTVDKEMNLNALIDLKMNFPNWQIGLSDHSIGAIASIVAVGLGITFIEKHYTLDKNMIGPDHKASITPNELRQLCEDIRRAEEMLGSEKKFVTQSEGKNKFVARKSIVAKKAIRMGEVFTQDNITCKRPGNGISPKYWYDVLGKKASKNFNYDQLIQCEGIKWEEEK